MTESQLTDRPARKGLRRWLAWGLPLLLVAGLGLSEALGWRFLRAPAEDFLSRQLERPARIAEPFRLHFLGGIRLHTGGIWIAAPPGFDLPHLVEARDLHLKLRYRDLWTLRQSGALRLAELGASRFDANLVRRPGLGATWSLPHADPDRQAMPLPTVDRLVVGNGRLVLDDPLLPADLHAGFHTLEGSGTATPVSQVELSGKFKGRPLRGVLTTRGLMPVATASTTPNPSPPLAAAGWLEYGDVGGGIRLDFTGEVADLSGRRDIRGEVAVKGPSLAVLGRLLDITLPTTKRFSLAGHVAHEAGLWRIDVHSGRVGQSNLNARFNFDPRPPRPLLSGELGGSRFVLADLAPAFGTRNEDGTPLRPPPGRTLPQRPLDLAALELMDARLAVNLAHVDLGNAFALPIAPLRARLELKDGRLALDDITARTARGSLAGDFALDVRTSPPRWQAHLALDGIRLQDWLKAAKARPNTKAAAPPHYVSGTLHGRARLSGSGHSSAEMLASLDGEARASVRDGRMSHLLIEILGLDVAQGLSQYLAGDESLPMTCAQLDLQAREGRVTLHRGWVDTPVTLLLAQGSVDLARERLDLRLVARPRNFSPLTLRTPIRISGSFAAPQAAPESGPIAARVLGGVALATLNPLAAVLPFLDPGAQSEQPC